MMHPNWYPQLKALGYTGALPDMWMAWLKDNGAEGDSIPELERSWLGSLGFTGALPDRWKSYLVSLGFDSVADGAPSWTLPASLDVMSLFANGEEGAWYDPSDMSTLFQDNTGTVPVTAVGQPVGYILDKSGRGNHLQAMGAYGTLQADGARRYIDGISEGYATQTIDMTANAQLTVCAGLYKSNDDATSLLVEFSGNLNSSTGAWYIAAPIAGGQAGVSFVAKGTNAQYLDSTGFPAPISVVVTAQADMLAPLTNMRVNTAQTATSSGDLGSGVFGEHQMYVGRRGSGGNNFTGRLYGLIVRGAESDAEQIEMMEEFMNSRTGAY